MTIREDLEIKKHKLTNSIMDLVYEFENTTGLKVDEIKVVRTSGLSDLGAKNERLLYIEISVVL